MGLMTGNRQVLILGERGTGKSNFMKYLLYEMQGNYAVFDPMREYTDKKEQDVVFRPTERRGEEAKRQLGVFLDEVVKDNSEMLDAVVIDEVNRYHHKKGELTGALGEMVDLGRHLNLSIFYIARRWTQVNTDLRGLVDEVVTFRLENQLDRKHLNREKNGWGDMVGSLPLYEAVRKNRDGLQRVQDIPLVT